MILFLIITTKGGVTVSSISRQRISWTIKKYAKALHIYSKLISKFRIYLNFILDTFTQFYILKTSVVLKLAENSA